MEEKEVTTTEENTEAADLEQEPVRQKRPYEDYVIEDPEDMDEAPDTGDMFDDEELYGEEFAAMDSRRRTAHTGISGRALICLWIIFAILTAVYVYVLFVNDSIVPDDVAGRDNTVVLDIPAGARFSLCTDDEINQLVNNYLLARTKADQTTLQRLVTDPSEFDDMAGIEIAAQYITAYSRTTCYMVPGLNAGEYIIYELSNLTIKDVKSTPLDIRSLYVVRQTDGSYKIDNSAMSEERSAYINDVTSSDDIQGIYKHVKENNDYLLRNDETFKKFQDMYSGN